MFINMAHFAKIENNIVVSVIKIDDEFETIGNEYINNTLGLSGEWLQTSYNNRIRKRYAGIGFNYDRDADVFYHQQPYPSWLLNKDEWIWEAPIPYPDDTEWYYVWNEHALNWEKTHKI